MNLSQMLRTGFLKSTLSASSTEKISPAVSEQQGVPEDVVDPTEHMPLSTLAGTSSLPPRPEEQKGRGRKRVTPSSFKTDPPPSKKTTSSTPLMIASPSRFSDNAEFGFLSQLAPIAAPPPSDPVSHPGNHFCPGWDFSRSSRVLTPTSARRWLSEGVLPCDLDALRQLSNEEMINVLAVSASQSAVLSARALELLQSSGNLADLQLKLEDETKKAIDYEERISTLENEAQKQQESESRARQELIKLRVELRQEQDELHNVKMNLAAEKRKSKELSTVNQKLSSSILVWEKHCKSWERKCNFFKGSGSGKTVENFVKSPEFTQLISKINGPVMQLGYNEAIRMLQQEHLPHKTLEELGYEENAGEKVDSVYKEVTEGALGFSATQFVPSTPVYENPEVDISELEKSAEQERAAEADKVAEQGKEAEKSQA